MTVSAATPTLTTTPTPATVALGTTSVTLKDTADLENGFQPDRHHHLHAVSRAAARVDTETVTVNGNGIYTTPTGFTLPTTGTVTGTYQWNATYSGDSNNNVASDINDANERVTVSAASPTLATIPHPGRGHAGDDPRDAERHGGPGGRLQPDRHDHLHAVPQRRHTPVDTETVTVNGNGIYTTPTGFTLPSTGTVTGTYQWDATYSGDSNNSSVSDINAATEQVDGQRRQPDAQHQRRSRTRSRWGRPP